MGKHGKHILIILTLIGLICSCSDIAQLNKQIKLNNDTIEMYKKHIDSVNERIDLNIKKIDSLANETTH